VADDARNFWQTAPGVITAIAALITAVGGVLGILVQNDVIGRDGDGTSTRDVSEATSTHRSDRAAPTKSPAHSTDESALIPWVEATATLVRRDGTSTDVKASTVGLACNTEVVGFENGQDVSLELVRSIEIDAVYAENSSADAVVTLLDGRELTDPVDTWNCPVTGTNELGFVEIRLEDIARIEFKR